MKLHLTLRSPETLQTAGWVDSAVLLGVTLQQLLADATPSQSTVDCRVIVDRSSARNPRRGLPLYVECIVTDLLGKFVDSVSAYLYVKDGRAEVDIPLIHEYAGEEKETVKQLARDLARLILRPPAPRSPRRA